MIIRKLLLTKIFFLFFLINTSVFSESCNTPSLEQNFTLIIPCVTVENTAYSTRLLYQSNSAYSWQWDGQLNPISCTNELQNCVEVNNMDLSFPLLDIEGKNYTAKLQHAPEIGESVWRYQSHTAKIIDLSLPTQQAAIDEIDTYMTEFVANNKVPGATLSIAKGNQVIYNKAFGVSNVDTQKATTTDTLFHIGSTNKAITSFLIAILVDEKVLSWDTKVQDIYSNFVLSNAEYASQITIRQLLDMTSGLPRDLNNEPTNGARGLLENLGDLQLIGAPGNQYEYSNLSVSMAAYFAVLAKKKSDNGQLTESDLDNLHADYEQLLKEKVLEPLAMKNTYLYVDEARNTGLMSHSHQLQDNRFIVSESVDNRIDVLAPSGGLKSSVNDMIKYMITEAQQGITKQGHRLVSEANMAVRQTLSVGVAADNDYGLGLEIKTLKNDIRYIGHDGSYDDFNSLVSIYPDQKVSFILLVNGDSEGILDMTGGELENKIAEVVNAL